MTGHKLGYMASRSIIQELEWVSEQVDIDHDICNAALDAIQEIQRLERVIEALYSKEAGE